MFLCIQQIHIVILRVQVGFLVRKYLQVLKRHRKLMSEKLHGKSLIQHICIKLLHQEVKCSIQNLDTAMNTPFSMEIHGITYDNEKTAGEILVQACTKMKKEHTDAADIGTFKGFKMKVSYSLFDNSFYVKLTRESSVTVEVKKDPVRNIERILTALRKMPGQKDVAEERLEGARQQLVQAKEEVNKPFEKENELRSVQERLTKINTELDMKPKEEPKKMIKKEELKKCL